VDETDRGPGRLPEPTPGSAGRGGRRRQPPAAGVSGGVLPRRRRGAGLVMKHSIVMVILGPAICKLAQWSAGALHESSVGAGAGPEPGH
jgi:hypothetical protein